MEIFLYSIIFIMGMVFGSFFTLAVYRIPIGEDITHKHSFCPKCKHKLKVLDLIPIFSYVFLGGKCRYCKEPIKIRYLLLEIVSGLVFLGFALSLRFNIYDLEPEKLIYFGFGIAYFCSLFIIAGIDKEKIRIQKSVLLFGFMVTIGYLVYLYVLGAINVYGYVIYLIALLALLVVDTIILRKKAKDNYPIEVVMLGLMMALFTGEIVFILTVIYTLLAVSVMILIKKVVFMVAETKRKQKIKKIEEKEDITSKDLTGDKKEQEQNIPIGFYLCITNCILLIFVNYMVR